MNLLRATATRRWSTSALTGLLGALALAAPAAAAAPSALTPPVAALAASDPGRPIGVIVQMRPGAGDPAALVQRAGGRVTMALPIIDGVAAVLPARRAARLARAVGVRAVSLDAPVLRSDASEARANLDRGGRPGDGLVTGSRGDERDGRGLFPAYDFAIRADDAWRRGLTGRGVGVAVIDTGIAGDLPDFRVSRDNPTSRVVANAVVGGSASAGDGFGHGTHVAGLIAGNSTNEPSGPARSTNWIGVAPEADLIAVKVADDDGAVTLADVVAGLQFVVEHKADYNIKVANLSLSSTVAEDPRTDPLDAAVEIAWFNGITVIAAAGNRGTDADAVSYSPANDPYVVSVGAIDDKGTKGTGDDELASWSSRGTTQTGAAKPDVLAPGAHLVSTLAPGSDFAALCPTCVVDERYFRIGGTSMAAAVASGAAALIAQAHPDWSPDQIKGALVQTLRNEQDGVGTIDVAGAAKSDGEDVANQDNEPSTILPAYDPTAAGFDRFSWTRFSWTRFSWTRFSWTAATGPQSAAWSRFSWTCDCVAPGPGTEPAPTSAETDRFSWTRFSWTRFSWTRFSWTASFTK